MQNMQENILAIARELLRIPTAPFREGPVRRHITDFCEVRGIAVQADDIGNLIATYGPRYGNPVLAFAAHMDHPGFIIESDSVGGQTTALFYGSVEESYFKGERVRVFTEGEQVTGTITRTQFGDRKGIRRVWLELEGDVRRGDTAMWDIPPIRVRNGRLYSRCCDDGVGCVSVLALLDELHRRRIRRKAMAVFTTAEESGGHGAKYLCVNRRIPKSVNLIAIEASSELPVARIGDGVVIRVGDSRSIFTPAVTAFLTDVARRLKDSDKAFGYQRKLMDGGACESTIYSAFGYTNGAVCVPLGNYHNRDRRKGRIAAEYVSVDDLTNMVKLFLAAVRNSPSIDEFIKAKPPSYTETRRSLGERLLW